MTATTPRPHVLNRDERRTLERIIKNDFLTMKAELESQAARTLASQLAALEKKYATKSTAQLKVQEEAHKLQAKINAELDKFYAAKKTQGFVPSRGYNNHTQVGITTTFVVDGKEAEIEKVRAEVREALAQAHRNLSRLEMDAQRKVLLTGVSSEEGMRILDGLPDASQILSQALARREPAPLEA